ncbi:TPA: hypothetical protein NGS96_004585 [Vibrio parahaemolyticus]|nr:hypothetical protein [Vibrio parahaemolyticus]
MTIAQVTLLEFNLQSGPDTVSDLISATNDPIIKTITLTVQENGGGSVKALVRAERAVYNSLSSNKVFYVNFATYAGSCAAAFYVFFKKLEATYPSQINLTTAPLYGQKFMLLFHQTRVRYTGVSFLGLHLAGVNFDLINGDIFIFSRNKGNPIISQLKRKDPQLNGSLTELFSGKSNKIFKKRFKYALNHFNLNFVKTKDEYVELYDNGDDVLLELI